jgi:hypothetical protein
VTESLNPQHRTKDTTATGNTGAVSSVSHLLREEGGDLTMSKIKYNEQLEQ